MAFNFEKEKLIKELRKRKPKKVLVQLPEGVKQNAFDIISMFEELAIEVIFSGETCWGGCSVSVEEAKSVNADLIVHFGHSEFMKLDFPVVYIPVIDELDIIPLLKKSIKELEGFRKIGLSYSIQHINDLQKIIDFYKENGKEVFISGKKGNVSYEGQILGCQYMGLKDIEKKVDCFVIIGNNFHSLGAALSVDKPVFLIDVYNDDVKKMGDEREKILRQRAMGIDRFREAKKVGVIIETKYGQKFGSAKFLVEKLENEGKKVIVITMSEITPDKLMNFYDVEGFVELACPRIAIDDASRYRKPVLTFKEALVALGEKSWEEVLKEGII